MPPQPGQPCSPWMLCPPGKLCLQSSGRGDTAVCWDERLFQGGEVLRWELGEVLVLSRAGWAWGGCRGSCAPCLAQPVLPVLPVCPGHSGPGLVCARWVFGAVSSG